MTFLLRRVPAGFVLRGYRVKVGNIAHMVWIAHFLFTDSAYIAHAFQSINHIVLSDKCQCYEYPWCYKSPEDDNPIYRLVRRTTAFPGGPNSLLSTWSLVFVIETIVISVQNICRSMLIKVSICTYYFELWSWCRPITINLHLIVAKMDVVVHH